MIDYTCTYDIAQVGGFLNISLKGKITVAVGIFSFEIASGECYSLVALKFTYS